MVDPYASPGAFPAAGGTREPGVRRWLTPGVLVAVAVAVALALTGTALYGPGLSPDTANYFAAAESLVMGTGYRMSDGTPLAVHPPLFSTLLAAFRLAGMPAASAARALNATAFGGIILVAAALCRAELRSHVMFTLCMAAILFSPALYETSANALTEALFTLLAVTGVLLIHRYLQHPSGKLLVYAGVAAGLACVQKYSGVSVVATGALLILAPTTRQPRGRRVLDASVFAALAALPLTVWVVRTYLATGTLTGPRPPAYRTIWMNAESALYTFGSWVVPRSLPAGALIGGALVCAAVLPAAVFLHGMVTARGRTVRPTPAQVGSVFILVYLAVLFTSASSAVIDNIFRDRFLAPTFVFVMLAAFTHIERLARFGLPQRDGAFPARAVTALVCVLWLCYPALRTGGNVYAHAVGGVSAYNQPTWRNSTVVTWLRTNPLDGQIFSNAPDVVYLYTGVHARMSPASHPDRVPVQSADLLAANPREAMAGPGPRYLVWFNATERAYLYPLAELQARVELREVISLPDGAVFRVP